MILCSYIKKQECTMSPPRVLSSLWVVGCLHKYTDVYTYLEQTGPTSAHRQNGKPLRDTRLDNFLFHCLFPISLSKVFFPTACHKNW